MNIELATWREVSQHLDLHDVLERVSPLLQKKYRWLSGMVVIEINETRSLATCVASSGEGVGAWLHPARRTLSPQGMETWQRWADHRQPIASHAMTSALRQMVGAVGEDRGFALLPLVDDRSACGLLIVVAREGLMPRNFKSLSMFREPFTCALRNDARHRELRRLRAAAEADREALLQRLQRDELSESVIGADSGLRALFAQFEALADRETPLLLVGETGCGKEVVARAFHSRSRRGDGPFVRFNCRTRSGDTIAAQLFGIADSADNAHTHGLFERAEGGTLLLDNIEDLPLDTQQRLLRVLQDGTFLRTEGERRLHADVRVIAACAENPEVKVSKGLLREDLWYRLSPHTLSIPPLRDRKADIAPLARYFAERVGARLAGHPLSVTEESIRALRSYDWPGNIRELATVIERAALLGDGEGLNVDAALRVESGEAPRASVHTSGSQLSVLDRAMSQTIQEALRTCGGTIEGQSGAAAALGINASTLRSRMRKLGIDWRAFRQSL